MTNQNYGIFTLYSPLAPADSLEHIRNNTSSCYLAASLGSKKYSGYAFVLKESSGSELVLEPVGNIRNSETPNLHLELQPSDSSTGTTVAVRIPKPAIIWQIVMIGLAGAVFAAIIHPLVFLLVPVGILVLYVCRQFAEFEVSAYREALEYLLAVENNPERRINR